eukprot:scaffold8693_cov119-Isochrysis_galbana.AAC.5
MATTSSRLIYTVNTQTHLNIVISILPLAVPPEATGHGLRLTLMVSGRHSFKANWGIRLDGTYEDSDRRIRGTSSRRARGSHCSAYMWRARRMSGYSAGSPIDLHVGDSYRTILSRT